MTGLLQMVNKKSKLFILGLTFLYVLISACGGSSKSTDSGDTTSTNPDTVTHVVQSALSEVNSHASATEAGVVGILQNNRKSSSDSCSFVTLGELTSVRGACSASTHTVEINWNNCTVDNGKAFLTGGWTEVFSGTNQATCAMLVNGDSVARTTDSSVLTFTQGALSGFSITTDTKGGTAWDGTVIPSTGVLVTKVSSTEKTVNIYGIHRVMTGSGGRTWFDHFITAPDGITVTGSRILGDRTVSGTVRVYHNLAKYTATNVMNNVKWESASCCYPMSGSIDSTFSSGSSIASSTLTFSSTCGRATFTDSTGTTSTVTLSMCQ